MEIGIDAKAPKRILGIDPGTNVLGFAIIDADKKLVKVIEIGVVTFAHISDDHTVKLRFIFEQVQDLIRQHQPEEMAIEAPFFGGCHCCRYGEQARYY
jgi:crossover junction endodeoxyribonuclease RuvC